MVKAVARIADENTVAWMREIVEQAGSSDAILFSGITGYVGLSVAEHLRIPAIGLGLWSLSPPGSFLLRCCRPGRCPAGSTG